MGERKRSKQLQKMLNGVSVDNDELKSLQNTANGILHIASQVEPSEESHNAQRSKLLASIVEEQESVTFAAKTRNKQQTLGKPQRRFAMSWIFIAATLVALAGGSGVVYASGDALPGDALYPVKIASEDVQLFFNDDEGDVDLLLEFMDERVGEMDRLVARDDIENADIALNAYENQKEQLTSLMTKMQPDDPVAGDALQAEVQNQLEEQARRMLNINEESGERLQIRDQTQDQLKTQDKLQTEKETEEPLVEESSDQNGNSDEKDNGSQGQQSSGSQSSQILVELQSYSLSQNDRITLHFSTGSSTGNLLARVNGVALTCSRNQQQLVCEGAAPSDGDVLVDVVDMDNGTIHFNRWITLHGSNSDNGSGADDSGNDNSNGGSGSGGKQH
jgi:hypothetical protein